MVVFGCKKGIFFDFALCFDKGSDMIRIESFRFEMREETHHRGIVITISSARHAACRGKHETCTGSPGQGLVRSRFFASQRLF